MNEAERTYEVGVQVGERNFVAPLVPAKPTLDLQPYVATLQHEAMAQIDAGALQGMRTVSETSTPVHRAVAVAIEGVFVLVVASLATFALTYVGASGAQVAIFFIVLVLAGVALLIRLNYTHSPIGNERYKAKLYADVQLERVASDERVQLAKVDAFKEMVQITYGRRDQP